LISSSCVQMKITKVCTWHIEGEIIDRNPVLHPVPSNYFQDYFELSESKTANKVQKILKLQQDEEEELLKKQ